jgi:protein MAK16
VREVDGKCYLFVKTIERAHSPRNLWERIPLSKNYLQAITQLDEQLAHWPNYLIHKNKQRLTKITQYLIRMRKLAKAMAQPQLERYNKKEERLLARKEAKALVAANLERGIEQSLLQRLKQVSRPLPPPSTAPVNDDELLSGLSASCETRRTYPTVLSF